MAGSVDVKFNHFDDLARKIAEAASQLVRKAAFDIEAGAKTHAPVDTGFLKSSVYTVTHDSTDYGQVEGAGNLLPEVEHPAEPTEATVAVGAEYGIYVEYGTARASAQPYLTPAAEAVRPAFTAAFERLEGLLR